MIPRTPLTISVTNDADILTSLLIFLEHFHIAIRSDVDFPAIGQHFSVLFDKLDNTEIFKAILEQSHDSLKCLFHRWSSFIAHHCCALAKVLQVIINDCVFIMFHFWLHLVVVVVVKKVRPAGLKPATLALEERCSVQLSYGRLLPFYYNWKGTVCQELFLVMFKIALKLSIMIQDLDEEIKECLALVWRDLYYLQILHQVKQF